MAQEIQLYSMNTPNGQKVGIALEEMGIPYTPHVINLREEAQFKPEFIKISPYSKIPAIVDPNGPEGKPISLFESGSILMYLAKKSGKFWPRSEHDKAIATSWMFFQVGGVGPMFGQFGHFYKMAKEKNEYGISRYTNESRRVLQVLEQRLTESPYLAGEEYTIADMATVPWVNALSLFYQAEAQLGLADLKHVNKWKDKIFERPAVKKGVLVCKL